MPSISGKTIGTNEDSFIELGFDYRAEVNNTFTIDIANVQLESGSVATPFEDRSFGEELALCQRYYYKHVMGGTSGPRAQQYHAIEIFSKILLPWDSNA